MTKNDWFDLPISKKRTLLEQFSIDELAKKFGENRELFEEEDEFWGSQPEFDVANADVHKLPKELTTTLTHDMNLTTAACELIDNSIDMWRKKGRRKDLRIKIDINVNNRTGIYRDNAGGVERKALHKLFIPGEKSYGDDVDENIGFFGQGAKAAILFLTNGASITSSVDGVKTWRRYILDNWLDIKDWSTYESEVKTSEHKLKSGETVIHFLKMLKGIDTVDLDDLRYCLGRIYAPLIEGALYAYYGRSAGKKVHKVHIEVNGDAVALSDEAPEGVTDRLARRFPHFYIRWSKIKGCQPKVYEFKKTFQIADKSEEIHECDLMFCLLLGVTQEQCGESDPERDDDFGIDIYGNGRLISPFEKITVGFGDTRGGTGTGDQRSKFIRGQLFIRGESRAMPWNGKKTEYINTQVSRWIKDKIYPVLHAHAKVADKAHRQQPLLSDNKYTFPKDFNHPRVIADAEGRFEEKVLPYWAYKESDPPPVTTVQIEISVTKSELEELRTRLGTKRLPTLGKRMLKCFTHGVAFELTASQLSKAKRISGADDSGVLSESVKKTLIDNLSAKPRSGR